MLDEEEARHAIKVLRVQPGDQISITDGKGYLYQARVVSISKTECKFEITDTRFLPKNNYQIHLGVAPTKSMDRMEWMVEKLTELGVDEISFVNCFHSERDSIKIERLEKKAVAAIKQSKQTWLPSILPIQNFEVALPFHGNKYIAHLSDSQRQNLNAAPRHAAYKVLIGPEGDFSADEVEMATSHGYQMVTLGNTVLRTETAAFAACHALHFINQ